MPRLWESNGRGGWVGRRQERRERGREVGREGEREGGKEGKKLKEEGEGGGGS